MRQAVVALATAVTVEACVADPAREARTELAASGTLRAGLNFGNPVLVNKDAATGQPAGVAVNIARELAKRLDIPIQLVTYDSAPAMADDAGANKWDVGFLGADPAREGEIAFTAPYVVLEATYLVPAGSRLQTLADVDHADVHIAARPRTAYDLALRRTVKAAKIVYPEGTATDLDLLLSGRADALAGLRHALETTALSLPGARVLEGHFATAQQAIGVPRGRAAATAYLESFIADIKKSGFVSEEIRKTGARGASVAP